MKNNKNALERKKHFDVHADVTTMVSHNMFFIIGHRKQSMSLTVVVPFICK